MSTAPSEAEPSLGRVERARRRRGRRVVGFLLGLLLLLATLGVVVRWVDEPVVAVALLQSVVPVSEIAVVVVVLVSAWRHRRVALAGVVPALVSVGLFVAPMVPHTVEPQASDLTILSTNLEFGQADTAQLYDAITSRHATVVVLVEVTAEALARVDAAGLKTLLPYAVGSPDSGASGTVIRSRYPLTLLSSGEGAAGLELGFRSPVARVDRPGKPFILKAVHPLPPTGWVQSWHDTLHLLHDYQQGLATSQPSMPVVLAGDFNASVDHPAYRAAATGLTDVTRAAGLGWLRTWPQNAAAPPFVQLDHILVRGFVTVDAGSIHLDDTDHAAVWGTIR